MKLSFHTWTTTAAAAASIVALGAFVGIVIIDDCEAFTTTIPSTTTTTTMTTIPMTTTTTTTTSRQQRTIATGITWEVESLSLSSSSSSSSSSYAAAPHRSHRRRSWLTQRQAAAAADDEDGGAEKEEEEAGATSSDAREAISDYKDGLSEISRGKQNGNGKRTDVVMKFGGSSLANYERIDHVAQLIRDQIELGYRPRAVICSAMGKTTNNLLSAGDFALEQGRVDLDAVRTLHKATLEKFDMPSHTEEEVSGLLSECEDMLNGVRLIQELSPKSLDQLVSYGERCSVRIMAARLNQLGVPAQAFDAWEMGILTDSNFGDAKLLIPEHEDAVRAAFERLDPNVVAVVTGFIGHDPNGKITTLGRGGSDLTATALGAALDLDEIQVWKDVDGILTSDPRLVTDAIPVNFVTFEEASELAYFGAQVLHPIAMQPAMKYNVPVRVKNSYNPSAVGTVITSSAEAAMEATSSDPSLSDRLVTAITYKRDVKLLDISSTQMLGAYGFLSRVFSEFETHKLSVDVLASSEVSVSLTLDKKQKMDSINCLLDGLAPYADVTVKEGRSILTLITDVERSSEVLATVFRVFSQENIHVEMMSQGASKVNISFILNDDQLEEAVLQLHKCFFEDKCVVGKAEGGGDAAAAAVGEKKPLVHAS